MMRVTVLVLVGSLLLPGPARAIEDETTPVSYNESAPTNNDIPYWTYGWPQPAVQPQGSTSTTGWNYCGSVAGNSAVYLGNGWVLTAAHVGAGDLNLNNVTYPMVPNTAQILHSVRIPGQAAPTSPLADLVLFRVSPAPSLPPLTIRPNDPVGGSSQAVMIGYGHTNGDRTVTWGFNTVTSPWVNYTEMLSAVVSGVNDTFSSNDFVTLTQDGTTNNYQVVTGDSGGPDFIYNSTTKAWELAGLNEAMLSNNGSAPFASAMLQLDTYLPQINAIMSPQPSPAMPDWAIGVLALLLVAVAIPLGSRGHLPSRASSRGWRHCFATGSYAPKPAQNSQ
jgi:hypothetical protein